MKKLTVISFLITLLALKNIFIIKGYSFHQQNIIKEKITLFWFHPCYKIHLGKVSKYMYYEILSPKKMACTATAAKNKSNDFWIFVSYNYSCCGEIERNDQKHVFGKRMSPKAPSSIEKNFTILALVNFKSLQLKLSTTYSSFGG